MVLIPSAAKHTYKLSLFIPICLDLRPKNHYSLDFVSAKHIAYKLNVILTLVIFIACDLICVCTKNFIHSLRSFSIFDTLVIIEHNHVTFLFENFS